MLSKKLIKYWNHLDLAILCDLFGMVKAQPFRLRDPKSKAVGEPQLGDENVTD